MLNWHIWEASLQKKAVYTGQEIIARMHFLGAAEKKP